MKEYYECHITLQPIDAMLDNLRKVVEEVKWSFSSIDGDPDLGAGIKCYATRQFNKREELPSIIASMVRVAHIIKAKTDAHILRKKVELVIYDQKNK